MKKYKLKNLDCANCAQAAEDKLNALACVTSAKVLFASSSLIIETSDLDAVKKEMWDFEQIEVIEPENFVESNELLDNLKTELVKIITYILFFGIATYFYHFGTSDVVKNLSIGVLVIVYLLAGKGVLITAFKNIMKGEFFDENFLMTFASLAAFAIGAHTEAVAVMLFYNVGEYFQDVAVNKSRKSIKSLLEIRPDYANLLVDRNEIKVAPDTINVGEIVVVKPGEKIPLDGIIIEGRTSIDKRTLTGESVPVSADVDSEVLAGTLNINGLIKVRVTKTFGESSVSKILDLVENATANKAKTESFITTFARYYTPVVFAIAAAITILPPLLGFGTFSEWLYRALVVLVVSCPCALVVSVPLGYFGGIGAASRAGVLVKGANYLEALSNVKGVVLDKTGTITEGVFDVAEIVATEGFTKSDVLMYAAYAESRSSHPIAQSINNAYRDRIDINKLSDYEEISGHGIRAIYDGKELLVGSDKILHKFDITHADKYCNVEGGSVAHIVVDGVYAGYIIVSDRIKNDSKQAIADMRKYGVETIAVLTGDNEQASQMILKGISIDEVHSNLLPEDKATVFATIKQKFVNAGKVIFVGDGINDAPVLAAADVGISMGGIGTDVAIETADVVIMNDSLSKINDVINVAKRTKNIIWQNIIFALTVKGLFIILGFFGIAGMWEAVFGDVGVALLALLNASRLIKDIK